MTAAIAYLASRILLPKGYRIRHIDGPEPRYAITDMKGTRMIGGASYEGSLDADDITVFASFIAEGRTYTEAMNALHPETLERIEATGDLLHRGVAYSRHYG